MATILRFRRRAAGGATGSPSGLKTAEPAYNMADKKLYVGFGDDGSGNATSVKAFGADDFLVNIPAGGTVGQALVKTSGTDGAVAWADVATESGATYTASGDGIELDGGNQFALNYGEIALGLDLDALYAPINHAHDASSITSGTLDVARIPVLPSQITVTSSGGIANVTAPQQASIGEGTVVTTTDGRRWVYSGSGSKTAEASYIELADISPEWSVIANKPGFSAVATSGSYTDLAGRPTLGTMASQNAGAVAITGGTIDGVTLDGGTF